ncbi:N-acetylglutamate synthase, GNAT family [Devosia lucknowensis]|uniref:N-acetylglutamate synthase, GNAT family n=1 Tax=Devosia lucknowensis TaxID=1096929 RepID=A0A1Y6G8G5_9HYPH|nr:GNAT family N-acetyltransferase [Devosia lucknowensis]SMQ86044.1 N-acetylglutamate synthase, GNAT family [Devosia lucknowensis]
MALPAGFEVSTDPARIDVDYVHHYLSTISYWAGGIPRDVVARSIENSMAFGLYADTGRQVGFARVITDKATFAWLADVFVDPAMQGRGLGKGLMAAILGHADLQGLRRFMLTTLDAHTLYAQYGFAAPPHPERLMAIVRSNLYRPG